MAIDVQETFERGGKELLQLLDYCVRSIQMDPLFLFLVRDFRLAPTLPKAVALYEIFCAPKSLGRISVEESLPPRDFRLQEALRPLRLNWTRVEATRLFDEENRVPAILPPRQLFDFVVSEVEKQSPAMRRIERRYKPTQSSIENLTGGKMSEAQRHFVDK